MGFHQTGSGTGAVRRELVSSTVSFAVPVAAVVAFVLVALLLFRANAEFRHRQIHVQGTVLTVHQDAAGFIITSWTGTVRYRDAEGATRTDDVYFGSFVAVGDPIDVAYSPGHPDNVFRPDGPTNQQVLGAALLLLALVAALFAFRAGVHLARAQRVSRAMELAPRRALFDWYPNRRDNQQTMLATLRAEDRLSWGPVTIPIGDRPPIDQRPTYFVLVYGDLRTGSVVIVNEAWTFVLSS
jgi:hypothetical protein